MRASHWTRLIASVRARVNSAGSASTEFVIANISDDGATGDQRTDRTVDHNSRPGNVSEEIPLAPGQHSRADLVNHAAFKLEGSKLGVQGRCSHLVRQG